MFTCPFCGGHTWGSFKDKRGVERGGCHGEVRVQAVSQKPGERAEFGTPMLRPCSFTWDRRYDLSYGLTPPDPRTDTAIGG